MKDMTGRDYRLRLEELVRHLGRDDIGVGEVVEADGLVHFTLVRGNFSHRAEIASDVLADRERALAALVAIIPVAEQTSGSRASGGLATAGVRHV
jgi:hypothetical protein